MIERIFKLNANQTTIKTELTAGLTTFLTMAYVILVNPMILSSCGVPFAVAFVATCLAAAFGSLMMALLANFPVAVAPSMGLNVFFSYVVVAGLGYPWQAALTAVMLSGAILLLLSLMGVCHQIMRAIPKSMTASVCAGIGLMIAILALKDGGVIVAASGTLIKLGHLASVKSLLLLIGFLLIVSLDYLQIPGALLISIVAISTLGFLLHAATYQGVFAMPPSLHGQWFPLALPHSLFGWQGISIIFTFFLVILFDSVGTLMGVLHRSAIWQHHKDAKRINRSLIATSLATIFGASLGTSSTGPYVESISGVRAGGRTGLATLVVSFLFILALFFSPLAKSIPAYATAPALLFVACLMMKSLMEIDWDDVTESIPAMITFIMIPLCFSIADGIGLGFIIYTAIKLLTGRVKEVKGMVWILTAIFLLYFVFKPGV